MAVDPISSLIQWTGNPGFLVLSWMGTGEDPETHSVSFTPAYVRTTQAEYAPMQRINLAVSGKLHVFQYSTNENLIIPTIFHDLPFFQDTTRANGTEGLKDLLSFIRYTLNYYAQSCTILTPDGFITHAQYWGGIESFQEGQDGTNMSPRAQRWGGTISWLRCQE